MRKLLKIVIINIIFTLALLAIIIIGPSIAYKAFNTIREAGRSKSDLGEISRLANLPSLRMHPWVVKHLTEFGNLKTLYQDYTIWRRAPFKGETITINEQGHRVHGINTNQGASQTWFFGGSSMWGYGVNDENTIPAIFEQLTNAKAKNFGEVGYTAHQSLNSLEREAVAQPWPNNVIFYDGVNDVLHKCREENNYFSSAQEYIIKMRLEEDKSTLLSSNENVVFSLKRPFEPIIMVFRRLMSSSDMNEVKYDGDADPKKRRQIAEAMYNDWLAAKMFTEAGGARFYAVLQPVAFIGSPNADYLPEVNNLKSLKHQYEILYQEFRRVLSEKRFEYLDLTGLFNDGNDYYIDFCHLNPEGNKLVAQAIKNYMDNNANVQP
jgi:hypothetical protein